MTDATKIVALTAIDLASYEPVRAEECGRRIELGPGEILISTRDFAREAEVTHDALRYAERSLSEAGFWAVRPAVPEVRGSRRIYSLLEWRRFIHPGRKAMESEGAIYPTAYTTASEPMNTGPRNVSSHSLHHSLPHSSTTPPRDSHATEPHRATEPLFVCSSQDPEVRGRVVAFPGQTNKQDGQLSEGTAEPQESEHERRMREIWRGRNGSKAKGAESGR